MTIEQAKTRAVKLGLYEHVANISYHYCTAGSVRLRTKFIYKKGWLVVELNGECEGSAVVRYESEECNLELYMAYNKGFDVALFKQGPWVEFLIQEGEKARDKFLEICLKSGTEWTLEEELDHYVTTLI